MKYSKFIVALVIILNVIFTAAVLYVFYHTSVEPVALIAGWFAFTTGELWFLSGITKTKVREEQDDAPTIYTDE
jgi:hypothetical protein